MGIALTALFCLLAVRTLGIWWQQALPGDLLYTAKRNIETVQLTASSSGEQAWLHLRFAERRVAEGQTLLAAARPDRLAGVLAAYEMEISAVQDFFAPQSSLTRTEQKALATALIKTETRHEAQFMDLLTRAPTALHPLISAARNTAQQARTRAEQVIRGEGEEAPAEKVDDALPTATHQPTLPPATPTPSATPTWQIVPTATPAVTALPALPATTVAISTVVTTPNSAGVAPVSAHTPLPPTATPAPPTATSPPPAATAAPTDTPAPTNTPPPPTAAPPPTPTPAPPPTAVPNNVVPTVIVPTVEIPTVEVPTVEIPTVEIPTVEIPTIEVPTVVLPDLGLPDNNESDP